MSFLCEVLVSPGTAPSHQALVAAHLQSSSYCNYSCVLEKASQSKGPPLTPRSMLSDYCICRAARWQLVACSCCGETDPMMNKYPAASSLDKSNYVSLSWLPQALHSLQGHNKDTIRAPESTWEMGTRSSYSNGGF
eukprot:jgi/Botrbrau1/15606/Bobra.0264s0006.1